MEIPVIIAIFALIIYSWCQSRRIDELEEHMMEHCMVLDTHADAIYGEEDGEESN